MNKANVFLLVVVSSLLTYISTATQPAATAGVAQEKWEWGTWILKNDPIANKVIGQGDDMVYLPCRVTNVTCPTGSLQYTEVGAGMDGALRVWQLNGELVDSQFIISDAINKLRKSAEQAGWHPYQRDLFEDEEHLLLRRRIR